MLIDRIKSIISQIEEFFARRFEKVIEINKKYSKPRIAMTPLTRIVLLLLRIYLLLLVAILFYKFFTTMVVK
jgi:hypothetical protein